MLDLKANLSEYLDNVVERLDVEDIFDKQVGVPLVRLLQPRIRHRRVAVRVYGVAAAVAVVLLVGGLAWLAGNSVDAVDNPTPTTVATPTLEGFTWTKVEGGSGLPPAGAFLDMVSNGSKLVASDSFSAEEVVGDMRLWTSVDGLTWSPERARLHVLYGTGGEFLAVGTGTDLRPTDGIEGTYLWRSSDGVRWTRADPALAETLHKLASFRFSGLTVDEILGLSLPDSSGGGPTGAVFKIDGRYVSYYWPADAEPNVASAVSTDGRTWQEVEAPDFLVNWFDSGSPRAMSDRGYSDRLWSGTFAVNGSRVVALTGDSDGHRLWESTDGLSWQGIHPDYGNAPGSHVFTQGVGLDEQYPGATTYGVFPMSDGWVILPWASEEIRVLFSVDGRTWQFIEPPKDLVGFAWFTRVAGDKVLFVLLGGTQESVRGLIVATYEGSSAKP